MKRLLLLVFLSVLSQSVVSNSSEDQFTVTLVIPGTSWVIEGDGYKGTYLLEKDLTFTYMVSLNTEFSLSEGIVISKDENTYLVSDDQVILSYNSGYRICTFIREPEDLRMSGSCINRDGRSDKLVARLIL